MGVELIRGFIDLQSISRSSISIGSPARSRMNMSFESWPSKAGRTRTALLSFRSSRVAALSPRGAAS
jgi:hypothetical protein